MPRFDTRRDLLLALCASPALVATLPALGQPLGQWQEGTDYTVVGNPQPTDSPDKVEVLDFFWYGCPHCYAFLTELDAWRRRLPADVAFKRIPVAFDGPREPHSKIYYALLAMGRAEDLHVKVFDAFHQKHMRLLDREEIADFMAANGIARDKWLATYDSFSVAGSVSRSKLVARNYQIDGTPTLAIDGRYLTSPSIVHLHSNAAALACCDFLIELSRREHARRR